MSILTTFPRMEEFERAKALAERLGLLHEVVLPGTAYRKVAVPALSIRSEDRAAMSGHGVDAFICAGWVDRQPSGDAPAQSGEPESCAEDVFGECSIMVLAPCVADHKKLRLIAHTSRDISRIFPYLNADMPSGFYNKNIPAFTFMESHRMVTLYPQRVTLAKTDGIMDCWRLLEKIRSRVNGTWARRASIVPSEEMRRKPPALEIYKRLPGTNCRECGDKTCMAFAMRLWNGEAEPSMCKPVFLGDKQDLRDALMGICAGLGAE